MYATFVAVAVACSMRHRAHGVAMLMVLGIVYFNPNTAPDSPFFLLPQHPSHLIANATWLLLYMISFTYLKAIWIAVVYGNFDYYEECTTIFDRNKFYVLAGFGFALGMFISNLSNSDDDD
jgi:hypothetical protein